MSNTYPCYKLSRRIVDNHTPLDNLRLETSPTRSYVVPYHHLEFATFESTQNEEVITLLFLNRTVRIIGRNLRPGRGLAGTHGGIHQPPAGAVCTAGQW